MNPLLKWPGSKRRTAEDIANRVAPFLTERGRFIELFAGSASVFFHLEPQRAVLVDINGPLMSFYEAVERSPEAVSEELQGLMELPFNKETFDRLKTEWNGYDFGVRFAARLIYLNRTCFNGLFRLNKDLGFNVAWGKKKKLPTFPSVEDFQQVARLLRRTTLYVNDYSFVLRAAHRGDVVYADPPYWGMYDRYAGTAFTKRDQRKLAAMLRRAAERGVAVFASNINCPEIQNLYGSWANMGVIPVRHKIGASNKSRRIVDEIVAWSTPPFVDPRQMDLFAGHVTS